jgi:hypothetical protein
MRITCLFPVLLWSVALPVTAAPSARQATPPSPAAARSVQAPAPARPAQAPASAAPVLQLPAEALAASTRADDRDARETRQALNEHLQRYPPSLGRVLKMDPSLLGSAEYLAAYPALREFLAQHPEVAHNPAFFLADVRAGGEDGPIDSHTVSVDMFRQFLEGLQVFAVFLVVVAALMWLIKTMIDYRRWSRLSKVQAEVHTKLLDRFAANENLIAYMQTDAGKRFLESAPIVLESEPRSIGAPFSRILWSLQAGVVVAAAGLGMQVLSRRVPAEVASSVSGFGALALAIGLGFVVSAAASYYLSHRLGLVPPAPPEVPSEPRASA